MTLLLADTFTSSLARLTGDEQKAAKSTAFDLQMDLASPGISSATRLRGCTAAGCAAARRHAEAVLPRSRAARSQRHSRCWKLFAMPQ